MFPKKIPIILLIHVTLLQVFSVAGTPWDLTRDISVEGSGSSSFLARSGSRKTCGKAESLFGRLPQTGNVLLERNLDLQPPDESIITKHNEARGEGDRIEDVKSRLTPQLSPWLPKIAVDAVVTHYITNKGFVQYTMTTVFPPSLDAAVEWRLMSEWLARTNPESKPSVLLQFASRPHQVLVEHRSQKTQQMRTAISFFYLYHDKGRNPPTFELWSMLIESQKPFYDQRLSTYKKVLGATTTDPLVKVVSKTFTSYSIRALGYSAELAFPGPSLASYAWNLEPWFLHRDGTPWMTENKALQPPDGWTSLHGIWYPVTRSPRGLIGFAKSQGPFMIMIFPSGIDAMTELKAFRESASCDMEIAVKMRAHQVRIDSRVRKSNKQIVVRSAITFYHSKMGKETTYEYWSAVKKKLSDWIASERNNYDGKITDSSGKPLPKGLSGKTLTLVNEDNHWIEGTGFDSRLEHPGPGPSADLEEYFGNEADRTHACVAAKEKGAANDANSGEGKKLSMGGRPHESGIWIPVTSSNRVISGYSKSTGAFMTMIFPSATGLNMYEELILLLGTDLDDLRGLRMRTRQVYLHLKMDKHAKGVPQLARIREAITFYNPEGGEGTQAAYWENIFEQVLNWVRVERNGYRNFLLEDPDGINFSKSKLNLIKHQDISVLGVGYRPKQLDDPGIGPLAEKDQALVDAYFAGEEYPLPQVDAAEGTTEGKTEGTTKAKAKSGKSRKPWYAKPMASAVVSAYAGGPLMMFIFPPDIDAEAELRAYLGHSFWDLHTITAKAHQVRVDLSSKNKHGTGIWPAISFYNFIKAESTPFDDWHLLEYKIATKVIQKERNNYDYKRRGKAAAIRLVSDRGKRPVGGIGYDATLENPGPGPDLDRDGLDLFFGVTQSQALLEHSMDADWNQFDDVIGDWSHNDNLVADSSGEQWDPMEVDDDMWDLVTSDR